jgi:hypothetical protein
MPLSLMPQELWAQRGEDDRQYLESLLAALAIPRLREELRELGIGGQVVDGQDAMVQQLKDMKLGSAGHNVSHQLYTGAQVDAATNGRSDSNKLGSGGSGDVYKGMLDGVAVAVKVTAPTHP